MYHVNGMSPIFTLGGIKTPDHNFLKTFKDIKTQSLFLWAKASLGYPCEPQATKHVKQLPYLVTFTTGTVTVPTFTT